MERPIKTRTYHNFLRAMKIVMAKGYDKETAGEIVRMQFDNMEWQKASYGEAMPLQWYLEKIEKIN